MSRHLLNEIDKLKTRILALSAMVEEAVFRAVRALEERDGASAQSVVDSDTEIDLAEVDIEEECQKILALHQPVAHDLRFIIAILKINAELERIGDAAVNIAERVGLLAHEEQVRIPFDFLGMARKAQDMLRESLEALVTLDARRAFQVIREDDKVDEMNGQCITLLRKASEMTPVMWRVTSIYWVWPAISSASPTTHPILRRMSYIWWKGELSGTVREYA